MSYSAIVLRSGDTFTHKGITYNVTGVPVRKGFEIFVPTSKGTVSLPNTQPIHEWTPKRQAGKMGGLPSCFREDDFKRCPSVGCPSVSKKGERESQIRFPRLNKVY